MTHAEFHNTFRPRLAAMLPSIDELLFAGRTPEDADALVRQWEHDLAAVSVAAATVALRAVLERRCRQGRFESLCREVRIEAELREFFDGGPTVGGD